MKSVEIHARIMEIIKVIEIHTSGLGLSGPPPLCECNGLNVNPGWLTCFIYKMVVGVNIMVVVVVGCVH